MGFGRELSIKAGLVAIALLPTHLRGAPPLGSLRLNEITKDENKLVTSYESCGRRLEDIAAAAEMLDPKRPALDVTALTGIALTAGFQNKSLPVELIPEVRLLGLSVVHTPAQAFLMSSRETFHKMVTNVARFGGYYLLFPMASGVESKLADFLRGRFAIVQLESPENQLTGDFALIPTHQAVAFSDLLAGKDAAATFATDVRAEAKPEYYPMPYSGGVVATGRGTVYVFGQNGRVSIFNRRGETKEIQLAQGQKAYSSHAAILERQGVKMAPRDPVKALELALARNDAVIAQHSRQNGISQSTRGVYAAEMEEMRLQYLEAQGRWAETEKARHLSNLLSHADAHQSLLPEFLRPIAVAKSELLTAPVDSAGQRARRVLRRFIAIRNPAGLQPHPFGIELRLVDDDCMHLQAAHAALGSLSLTLDQEGLLAGGILAFTYSESGALESIAIEDNGFISMAHGERVRHELFHDEIDFLAKQLRKSLVGTPAASARIFESDSPQLPQNLAPAGHP